LTAKGQTHSTSRELEELGGVNVQIEFRRLRNIDVFRMDGGEIH